MTSPIQSYLASLHERFAGLDDGHVASYIPELAKADPSLFAIVVATVDGQVYEVGASRERFTIQSISKPLVYGVALEDNGLERVRQAIGAEPTGDAFNSISLEAGTGRPFNPMINAGAIATSSLVGGTTREARLARVVDVLSAYAGRPLDIDDSVFASERDTGHRNRAIGHMLRNYGIIENDPEPALDLYFRQCAVRVDCRDLALTAATLANGGLNPLTGQRAVKAEFISPILSVMTTCGMYDYAGEWVYRIGLPAKSGVGGGIIAVLPGQLGIGVFSPALDARGNSVRGVAVCTALSHELGLHFLLPPKAASATVRARYSLDKVRSKRRRSGAENAVLDTRGRDCQVFEIQGDLRFATVEPVLREIVGAGDALRFAVIDFKRVTQVDAAAGGMLARLASQCHARGQRLIFTRVRRGSFLAGFESEMNPRHAAAVVFQPQLDLGLEWCERQILEAAGVARSQTAIEGLAHHRLCEGASAEDVAHLAAVTQHCQYEAGMPIVRSGDPADRLYFLMRGKVSVTVELAMGGFKRLSTLSAGAGFGESALLTGGRRSADVRADTEVECLTLRADAFARLEVERPSLAIRLLHNLLRSANDTVGRLTVEVAALEG